MRRPQRLIAAAILIALSSALAGCSSGFGSNFDPTDLLDWLDTKKKLPGERKPVFPEGVPGLEQGVPRDLYKGTQQQQQDNPNAQAAAMPPQQPQQQQQQPLEPPPGSKQALKKLKGKPQAPAGNAASDQPGVEPDGETAAAAQEDGTQGAPPAPKKKIVRKRTTAPPPDQAAQTGAPQSGQPAQSAQQSSQPFPAPIPGGSFTR